MFCVALLAAVALLWCSGCSVVGKLGRFGMARRGLRRRLPDVSVGRLDLGVVEIWHRFHLCQGSGQRNSLTCVSDYEVWQSR